MFHNIWQQFLGHYTNCSANKRKNRQIGFYKKNLNYVHIITLSTKLKGNPLNGKNILKSSI